MPITSFLALRFLHPRRGGGFFSLSALLAIGGIAMGVATLVAVLAIFDGYRETLETLFMSTLPHLLIQKHAQGDEQHEEVNPEEPFHDPFFRTGDTVTATKASEEDAPLERSFFTVEEYTPLVAQLSAREGVALAAPIIRATRTWCVSAGARDTGCPKRLEVTLYAEPFTDGQATTRLQHLVPESTQGLRNLGSPPAVFLSEDLHRVLSESGTQTLERLTLSAEELTTSPLTLEVAGTLSLGLRNGTVYLMVVSLDTAQRLLGVGTMANGIAVKMATPTRARVLQSQVQAQLAPGRFAVDWISASQKTFHLFNMLKFVIGVALFLIIAVSSLSMKTTLTMMVRHKTGQMAILTALGCTPGTIRRIFLMSSLVLCGLGLVLGLLLGFATAGLVQWSQSHWLRQLTGIRHLVVHWDATTLGTIALAVLGVGLLSALLPASQAAKMDPIVGLRGL